MSALALVHMLKTGGTSLRQWLEQHCPGRVINDYDDIPLSNRPEHTLHRRRRHVEPLILQRSQGVVIYGHFILKKYADMPEVRLGAIFRNPAARVVSHYFHYLRNRSSPRNELLPPGLSLIEFAGLPKYADMYRFLLGGIPVSQLAYVGITERLDESVRLLRCVLESSGVPASEAEMMLPQLNRASEYDDPWSYIEREGLAEELFAAQAANFECYWEAQQRFEELCSEHAIELMPRA